MGYYTLLRTGMAGKTLMGGYVRIHPHGLIPPSGGSGRRVNAADDERLAIAVIHFGLSPSEYRELTVSQWKALVKQHNKAHKKR